MSMENSAVCAERIPIEALGHGATVVEDRVLLAVIGGPEAWEGPRGAAWATLWDRHARTVSKAAEQRARELWIGDAGMQAELVEEAGARVRTNFTHLAEARRLSPDTASVAAFLWRSVRNACTDVFREQKRLGQDTESIDDLTGPPLAIPDTRAAGVEAHCAAHDLLARLAADPDEGWKQATVLRLVLGEERTTREVAAYFQVAERTVYRWKREGLRKVSKWADITPRPMKREHTAECDDQGEIDEESRSSPAEAGVV